MTRDEQETNLCYDYAANRIRVYTTRQSVLNGFRHRLGPENVTMLRETEQDWSFTVPMGLCRKPELVAKVINPDAKGDPLPDSVKEAWAATA